MPKPKMRETRMVIRFATVEDAGDFVREARERGMIPSRAGLRRVDTLDAATGGKALDMLIVAEKPGAAGGWVVGPKVEGVVTDG